MSRWRMWPGARRDIVDCPACFRCTFLDTFGHLLDFARLASSRVCPATARVRPLVSLMSAALQIGLQLKFIMVSGGTRWPNTILFRAFPHVFLALCCFNYFRFMQAVQPASWTFYFAPPSDQRARVRQKCMYVCIYILRATPSAAGPQDC